MEVSLSSELTAFESTDNPNPAIFSATRVAGIYMRSTARTDTEAGYAWRPKVVLDRALFPQQSGAYDYSGLSIRMRVGYEGFGQYHHAALYHSAFNRDGDDLSGVGVINELVVGGRTYVCFVPDNRDFHWRQFLGNAANNNAEVSFQILKSESASPVFPPTDPQFLSDDPTTAWVDGTEFVTGLYEGDANGHPVARILPPLSLWNDVVARSDTYVRGGAPDARFGVEGNKWLDLSNGKGYIKNASNVWVEVVDFATQAELNAAIAGITGGNVENWDDIPINTQVGIGRLVVDDGLYYGSWTAHQKGSTKPGVDTANWRLISNYIGSWRSGNYPVGTLTFRGGGFWVSSRAIVRGNPSPTGTNGGAYWTQLDVQREPVRYAKFGINSGLDIPASDATTPLTLTIPSALINSNEATGHIARASSGDAVDVGPGSYEAFIRVSLTTPADNIRSSLELDAYDGTTVLDVDDNVGYVRSLDFLATETVLARLVFTVSAAAKIRFRVKFGTVQGSATDITNVATAAGGYIYVNKL